MASLSLGPFIYTIFGPPPIPPFYYCYIYFCPSLFARSNSSSKFMI